MVRECRLTMECRLNQTIELPKDYFFIAEVISVYANESVLTDGKVDPVKLKPFVLTMPDNGYWALGERIGEAWEMGKTLLKPVARFSAPVDFSRAERRLLSGALKNRAPTAPAMPNAASTR